MKTVKGKRGRPPGMKGGFRDYYDELKTRIWFYPAILTAASVVVAFSMVRLDRAYSWELASEAPWLFAGTAEAAWSLLSALATSLITVVSIAFSITIIALQQASSQYSPRVLRTFTSDKGNQVVLGMYLATFVYSLLVLRTVRGGDDGFVPALSVNAAIFFTLLCLGLLIFFIHRIATSLEVVNIIKRIHEALMKQIENLYPETDYFRLTDNWLELTVRFIVEDRGMREVKDAISREILNEFEAAGITVASQTFDIVGVPSLRAEIKMPPGD
ncbi:MAG TPA: DUF2254 family protein [Syntrophales bacterium]|nr:DUF2254 family protein [Syntrophales bacterium]